MWQDCLVESGALPRAGLVSGLPLALRQHGAGLLAGVAVDEVVAEEDLRRGGVGGAVLGHVLRADVDGGGIGLLHELHGGSLGAGAGHTVGLALGGLDDEIQAAVVGRLLVQLEGEGLTLAYDGGAGGIRGPPRRLPPEVLFL